MEFFSMRWNSFCSSTGGKSYKRCLSEETHPCSPEMVWQSGPQLQLPPLCASPAEKRNVWGRPRDWDPWAATADLGREVVWAQENHKGNEKSSMRTQRKAKRKLAIKNRNSKFIQFCNIFSSPDLVTADGTLNHSWHRPSIITVLICLWNCYTSWVSWVLCTPGHLTALQRNAVQRSQLTNQVSRSTMMQEQADRHTPLTKINSKWIKD